MRTPVLVEMGTLQNSKIFVVNALANLAASRHQSWQLFPSLCGSPVDQCRKYHCCGISQALRFINYGANLGTSCHVCFCSTLYSSLSDLMPRHESPLNLSTGAMKRAAAAPSSCEPEPKIAKPEEAADEAVKRLPPEDEEADPFLGAQIQRVVDGNMFKGQVAEIKVREAQQRLYLIRYEDGHLEHLTGEQVKECKIEKESEPSEDEDRESELDELSESDQDFLFEDSSLDSGDSDFVTKPAKRPEDACFVCGRNQGSQFYGGECPDCYDEH